jgi:hypothetical protein
MRKTLIILTSTLVAALNINALGQLDYKILDNAKQSSQEKNEIVLKESINWSFGSTLFKLVHFAELMFVSEIGRRRTRIIN